MNAWQLVFVLIAAVVTVTLAPAAVNLNASTHQDDFIPETCDIKLKTGEIIQQTRSSPEVDDCDGLQKAWANTTYAEYEQWIQDINEARQAFGEEFAADIP